MVENFGLGEAIAGGTRLSGEFGSPITRGLQMGMQNDFANLQREQQRQAKLQKQAEDMAKFASIDYGKWYNQKRGKEYYDFVQSKMPEVLNAYKSGDVLEATKKKNEIIFEGRIKKSVDDDEKEMDKTPEWSVTKRPVQKLYNEGGIEALDKDNQIFWFAPLTQVDAENGNFKVNQVKNPNIDRLIGTSIKNVMSEMPEAKYIGNAAGGQAYEVDVTSPRYKEAKAKVIDSVLGNNDLVNSIVYTQDFREHYKKFLADNKIDPMERDEAIVEEALKTFIADKYNVNEVANVKIKQPRSSSTTNLNFIGGKNVGGWDFNIDANGMTDIELPRNTIAKPLLTGSLGGKNVSKEIIKPKARYIGNDKFEVSGLENFDGELMPMKDVLIVPKSEIVNVFKLTENGLKSYFPNYTPAKVEKPKAEQPKSVSKWDKNKR